MKAEEFKINPVADFESQKLQTSENPRGEAWRAEKDAQARSDGIKALIEKVVADIRGLQA